MRLNKAFQSSQCLQSCVCVCVQCVYELTQCGANLDATNKSGETALHAMTRSGKFECVIGLLAKGASAAEKGANGDNALHMAVEVVCFRCLGITALTQNSAEMKCGLSA